VAGVFVSSVAEKQPWLNGDSMNENLSEQQAANDEMLPEYDFSGGILLGFIQSRARLDENGSSPLNPAPLPGKRG
jgi:hypothetical protein